MLELYLHCPFPSSRVEVIASQNNVQLHIADANVYLHREFYLFYYNYNIIIMTRFWVVFPGSPLVFITPNVRSILLILFPTIPYPCPRLQNLQFLISFITLEPAVFSLQFGF